MSPRSPLVSRPSAALTRRNPHGYKGVAARSAAAFTVSLLAASHAAAQAQGAIQDEFTVQRFNPAPGPRNFITTRGARTDGEMAWSAGLVLNYAKDPFVVRSCLSQTNCNDPNAIAQQDVKVVENMVTADVMGSFTPIPRLQLGLRLPVTWENGIQLTNFGPAEPAPSKQNAFGLGDPELEAKARLYGEPKDTMVLGGALFVTGPLGHATAEGRYIGDSTPTAGLRGIFDGKHGPYRFGANLAGVLRGTGTVGTTEIGPEFRYGVAAGYEASPVVEVIVDGFGGTKFSSKRGTNSLEIDGAARITPPGSPINFLGGAGVGVIEGVGVPAFRVFIGAMYVGEVRDRDGDGIMDNVDQCPTDPEDQDGFQDADGCPDPDNDGDLIKDRADKCPNQPEDNDGFQDQDGCPDPDNDHDGIPDDQDRCPTKPETKNGFKDEDGCPDEPDSDQDGVPDSRDKCPNEPEDTDGFKDEDGCPDPDNDNDGIPDNQDECVDEPETKNGFQDADGCPDTPGGANQPPGAPKQQPPGGAAQPPGAPKQQPPGGAKQP